MDSFDCAKQRIRKIIARSSVPEDPLHAENTLKWLLMLEPKADPALQIAAYAHDIDHAVKRRKVHQGRSPKLAERSLKRVVEPFIIMQPIALGSNQLKMSSKLKTTN